MRPDARRKRRDAQETEAALLRAALTVFADDGLENGGIGNIAARARMSKGAVYLHDLSKVALFEAVRAAIEAHDSDHETDERIALTRIIICNGPRFPHLVEHYYAEVLAPQIAVVPQQSSIAVVAAATHLEPFTRFPELLLEHFSDQADSLGREECSPRQRLEHVQ